MNYIVIVMLATAGAIASANAEMSTSSENDTSTARRVSTVQGVPVSGPNDVCGVGQWILPEPFGEMHFTVIGSYDPTPGAINALPLSEESCADNSTLLATYSNSVLNNLGGIPEGDFRLTNVPLRDVQMKIMADGTRATLPEMSESDGNPFPPTKSSLSNPITAGDWFNASGKLRISCNSDGSSQVRGVFRDLIPNGIYGVYATWITVMPGTTEPTFIPFAFGGSPSLVVPNSRGTARFSRDLDYCPFDPSPDGSQIMFVNVGYHLDSAPSGVMPQLVDEVNTFTAEDGDVYTSTTPPGTVTMPHLQFPINVTFKQ